MWSISTRYLATFILVDSIGVAADGRIVLLSATNGNYPSELGANLDRITRMCLYPKPPWGP